MQIIDLVAVFKATQAIAHEIELEQLLCTSMQILLENTDAQLGYLLLPHTEPQACQWSWNIKAAGYLDGQTNDIQTQIVPSLPAALHLPVSIIHYVTQTSECIVLDNAIEDRAFKDDPYIQNQQTRSLLCIPLLNPQDIIGLIYLENTVMVGAFTSSHLEVLQLLSWQISISIGNAQLHQHLCDREQQLSKREAEINNGQIMSMEQDVSDRRRLEQMNDQFISTVSHALRTPLTTIRGALGILESGILDDDPIQAQEMVQMALSNSDHLMKLVNDIVELGRLEAGKVEWVMDFSDLASVIDQAVQTVQTIADTHNITLSIHASNHSIYMATHAMLQVLVNLLSYAIKVSPPGSIVELTVDKIEARDLPQSIYCESSQTASSQPFKLASNTYTLLVIKNQGQGLPLEKIRSIFGQPQRIGRTELSPQRGMELGLAICRSIVLQHQGLIWAESGLGEENRFYVALPDQFE
jgi:signal transduction histidine kinase